MNPDRVIGTAVLVTEGAIQWLHYIRVGANFEGIGRDTLPVMQDGGPPPTEKLPACFPENRPWRYRIDGHTLHVCPSVHIKDWWHNDGTWSVRFVLATGKTHGDHIKQLVSVNPEYDTAHLIRNLS